MPRGNTKGNKTNSPIIGDAGVTATPEELRQLTRHALELFDAAPPDLHNVDQVREAITAYFQSCDRHGVRPANLGLYAALGMTKQEVSNVLMGKTPQKVSPECIDLLKKAKLVLSTYRESLALAGKLNPVTAIFWAKNFDQMQDQTQIEVTAQQGPAAGMTPEQIARQIEQDIPIDAEYKESDNSI